MSFGVSVGDILAIGQFAWNVYKACKGAPSEFEEISREVSTLHTAIKELQDEVENEDSILNRAGNSKRKQLEDLVAHCRTVLQQLERLVTRYGSLGTNQKRTLDRIKFDTKEVQDIRGKLTFHTSAIQLFLATLGTGSLGRIEKKLETILEEISSGRSKSSILTTSGDDKADAVVQWKALKSELVEDGFPKHDLDSHKQWVKAHEQRLVDVGELQEHVPAAKQRNQISTSSSKGQRTPAQRSKNQPPVAKIDNSGSDLEVNSSSSDSKASTTSAHTATASGNKITRTPAIDTPKQETNQPGRNDARKLRPPKAEASSSSPHRTESPAQKDNKESNAKDQSSLTVNPSSGPSESKTSSSSPRMKESSAQKDDKVSKAKDQSFMIGDPSSEPRSPPLEAKTVERPLHLTLEELFTGTRKKVKIPRELPDKSGKRVISDESVKLKIKPGLKTGYKFKRRSVGEEGPQHIFFIVTEVKAPKGSMSDWSPSQIVDPAQKPHPTFTRDKNNINSVVELDLEEAFTGWSRTVFTIDGKYVPVSDAGPTPPGHQMTFPGLGMPKSRSPDERGNFIVTIKVKFPSSLSKDERKSIEQALRVSASRSDI